MSLTINRFWRCLLVFLAVAFLAFPVEAQKKGADAKKKEQAKELFELAESLYDLQRYDQALHNYEEAYLLTTASELLFNIGQCYRQLGKFEEARKSYKAFLRKNPTHAMSKQIEEILQQMDELEQKTKQAQNTISVETMTPKPTNEPSKEPTVVTETPTSTEPEPTKTTPPNTTPSVVSVVAPPANTTLVDASPKTHTAAFALIGGSAAITLGTGIGAYLQQQTLNNLAAENNLDNLPDMKRALFRGRLWAGISGVFALTTVGLLTYNVLLRPAKKTVSISVSPNTLFLSTEF